MRKKCPNCDFNIKKFTRGTKRYPHVCSRCHAKLYMPAWISWLSQALMMASPLVFFFLLTIVSLEIVFILIGFYILVISFIHRFFKPIIKKIP